MTVVCAGCGLYSDSTNGVVHWHPKPGEPGFVCPGAGLHGYPVPRMVRA